MTNEELVTVIRKGENDDDKLMELWNQNRGIIWKTVNKFDGVIEKQDAMQECFIALLYAVQDYNPKDPKAGMFSTYLTNRCRWRLLKYRYEKETIIRIPSNLRQNMFRYKRFIREWYQQYGTVPDDYTICRKLKIGQEYLENLRKGIFCESVRSTDAPLDRNDPEGETLRDVVSDTVPDTSAEFEDDAIEGVFEQERRAAVWSAVETLKEKEGEAIRLYYRDGLTYSQIGEATGVSGGMIRQRIARGLRQLRSDKNRKELREYIDRSEIYSQALTGGVETFNRTWTSSTEKTALWKLEMEKERRDLDESAEALQKQIIGQALCDQA